MTRWVPGRPAEAAETLYPLLPAVLRRRDAEGSLRALLAVMDRQRRALDRDVDELYDSWFIETCPEWAVPYLADLLGVRGLPDIRAPGYSRRALVANTLRHRRRKGTPAMLGDLAADVTGWGAHAAPFLEALAWTQNDDHLRVEPRPREDPRDPPAWRRTGTLDLRDAGGLDLLDGPFDTLSHSLDARPIARTHGWHHHRKVGVFLWRLASDPIGAREGKALARRSDAWACPRGFHVSPLGNPTPLFAWPEAGLEGDDLPEGADPRVGVPGPIGRLALARDLRAYGRGETWGDGQSAYCGPGRSLQVWCDGEEIDPRRMVVMDLTHWSLPPPKPAAEPEASWPKVAIDPVLGRITVRKDPDPAPPATPPPPPVVEVAFHQGLAAPIGGGGYDRRPPPGATPEEAGIPDTVDDPEALGTAPLFVAGGGAALAAALANWAKRPDNTVDPEARRVVQVDDSLTYTGSLTVALDDGTDPAPGGELLVVQARAGCRPFLDGPLTITGGNGQQKVVLRGLVLRGPLTIEGNPALVLLEHCTLVPGNGLTEEGRARHPGQPSLDVVDDGDPKGVRIRLDRCISGPVRAPAGCRVEARHTVLDSPGDYGDDRQWKGPLAALGAATGAGPDTELEAVTVLGPLRVRRLEASDCLFTTPVHVELRQEGCVRFSHLPLGSRSPRRYQCQPDLAIETVPEAERRAAAARLAPSFTSSDYGHPAYAQLGPHAAREVLAGSEQGDAMGAHGLLAATRREAALRRLLGESLPVAVQGGLIHVT